MVKKKSEVCLKSGKFKFYLLSQSVNSLEFLFLSSRKVWKSFLVGKGVNVILKKLWLHHQGLAV